MTLDADLRLRMNPVKELEALRGQLHVWPVSDLNNRTLMVEEQAHALEVELSLDIARSHAEQYGIALGDGLRVFVDTGHSVWCLSAAIRNTACRTAVAYRCPPMMCWTYVYLSIVRR